MLFNSYEFIFVFLPVVLSVYLLVKRWSLTAALGWLVVASLAFYAYWRPVNVLIIAPSILINFAIARALLADRARPEGARWSRWLLALGVIANLCFLGYFKYVAFFQTALNDFADTDFIVTHVILPLGISFITFQKIAFLVDVYGGRVTSFRFRDFCLFVLFFPQLIAGPIVHYREMMPQFHAIDRAIDQTGLALGITLFCFGLFKKVVLADGIATEINPIIETAAAGGDVALIGAWIAAVGFTLQMYFDFSGYSDMAAGLACCIGVRLPLNFDSPLKARNIIDFWARWHVTLTRFLNAYVYNPLVLSLTRRRLKRGKPPLTPANPSFSAFLVLLAVPTLLTMFLSGLWHGAGYLFVLWGLLHGVYLCLNHAWRTFGPQTSIATRHSRLGAAAGFALTFLSVVVAMVLFRGPTPAAALEILNGMAGLNGLALPVSVLNAAGLAGGDAWIFPSQQGVFNLVRMISWTVCLTAIALLMPNTFEMTSSHQPVIGYDESSRRSFLSRWIVWQPSAIWAVIVMILSTVSVFRLAGESEFLYWQF